MNADLIAPCGMNCRLCYAYIRKKNQCAGCGAPDDSKPKSCSNCKIVICEKRAQNGWATCAFCETHCRRLKGLDKRYHTKYHMSMVENLAVIRNQGMQTFLQQQNEKYRCPSCGEIVCVHKDECPLCKASVWQTSF